MAQAYVDGVLTEVSDAEVALTVAFVETDTSIRGKRDRLLAETDVWALSDRTMSDAQTAYRQALRDITDQAGFPTDITWPTKPE
mgnify:CR=1 FL=1